ncbi:hypothetical protein [Allocoleopsis sp.]
MKLLLHERCSDLRFSQGETPRANAAALRYRKLIETHVLSRMALT